MNCKEVITSYNIPPLKIVSWQKRVKMGLYMKGAIKAAKGAICTKCGNTSFESIEDDFLNYKVPKCTKCFGPPNKLRVDKYLPNINGGSERIPFYRDLDGNLLTKISHAIGLIGKLNDEMKNGTFKPEEFDYKSKERLLFKNFINEYIEYCNYRTTLPEHHDDYLSPGGLRNKLTPINNQLIPYFKDVSINKIDDDLMLEFHKSFKEKFRTRDLALGELRTIIIFAYKNAKVISQLPIFPKIAKARKRKSSEIPDEETQSEIIHNLSSDLMYAVYVTMATFVLRPSEVVTIKIKDINLKRREFTINSHVSKGPDGNVIIPGRKSIRSNDELGELVKLADNELWNLLVPFIVNKSYDDFLFPGRKPGMPLNPTSLYDAWADSCKKLGYVKIVNGKELPLYTPYAGTKSATLTNFLKRGGTLEQARALAAHKHSEMTETYAKIAAIDTSNLIRSDRFMVGSRGFLEENNLSNVVEINR